jgi:hypothetical protein
MGSSKEQGLVVREEKPISASAGGNMRTACKRVVFPNAVKLVHVTRDAFAAGPDRVNADTVWLTIREVPEGKWA